MNTEAPFAESIKSSLLLQFLNGYLAEVDGEFNTHVTKEEVEHPPTRQERLTHSLFHGGFQDYHRRFKLAHPEIYAPRQAIVATAA